MNNSGKTFLSDFEFTDSDIEFVCIELSYSASQGPDGIHSSSLKIWKKQLKKPLFNSWRSSLNKSIIHPDLLLVLISTIYKGGSRVDPGRYRPVALTSHLIKVFERVLRKALVNHLEGFNLIPNSQHGFRAHRSTLIQLLTYWDNVLECLEKGETVDVMYTDFSKAFDQCVTDVLLRTLTLFVAGRGGFRPPPNDFFDRSTLKDCKSWGHWVSKSKLLYWEDTQKGFGSKNFFESGPEAVEVGLAENLSD